MLYALMTKSKKRAPILFIIDTVVSIIYNTVGRIWNIGKKFHNQ